MSDEYLWDKSGEPAPEVRRLEAVLQALQHAERPLDLGRATGPVRSPRWNRTWTPVALAAAALVVAAIVLWPRSAPMPTPWSVGSLSPGASVNGAPANAGSGLAMGDVLETGPAARLSLRADGVGALKLGPASRLRVVRVDRGAHWFALDRGVLDADISAPPGAFAVETPAVRAVDLGCRYTLGVGPDGTGTLHVTLGWVALERAGRESLVPAGAICAFRPHGGPGTPYFEGASQAFIDALARLDSGHADARAGALDVALQEARDLDGLALWHLLTRVDGAEADRVFDRLGQFVPAPAGVTKDAVRRRDASALAAWWTAIGLGDLAELRAGVLRAR